LVRGQGYVLPLYYGPVFKTQALARLGFCFDAFGADLDAFAGSQGQPLQIRILAAFGRRVEFAAKLD